MTKQLQQLSIIGAGPGDEELITIKGLRALQEADIILYDALVNPKLLAYAPNTPAIFVGKRLGFKSYMQDEINELILSNIKKYGHVVRLKGGDPYVFGRGMEEAHFISKNGFPVQYIPGITSAIAAPAAANIAVTLRGVSRSFWTMTATTDSGDLNPDIRKAALADTTVIILMGTAKLREITEVFESVGRQDVAVAVIQDATRPTQAAVFGNISDIETKVLVAGISNPAVIVIGEVVAASRKWILTENEDLVTTNNF